MVKKKAKVVEEVVEEDDLELEELEEDAEEEAPPAKKKGRADDVAFGAKHLAILASQETGKKYEAKTIRTLLRKMARDGSGRLNREVSPDNRARYSWEGPDDPEVKLIIKAIKAGEIEADRKEQLDKLRETKLATKGETPVKTKKKKKAAPPPVDEDDEDLEELEDEDDE